MSENVDETVGSITFDDTLDITLAASYHEQLNQLLNQYKTITLNAENVERIDGAGLQLLAAFMKSAASLHISVEWQACSELVKKQANLLGLTGSLGFE